MTYSSLTPFPNLDTFKEFVARWFFLKLPKFGKNEFGTAKAQLCPSVNGETLLKSILGCSDPVLKGTLDNHFKHTVFQKLSDNFRQLYRVFHWFRQDIFANGGSILSSSRFYVHTQLTPKMKLASKVVKFDSKIVISLPWSKSVKLTVSYFHKVCLTYLWNEFITYARPQ